MPGTPYLVRIIARLRHPKDLRIGVGVAGDLMTGGKVTPVIDKRYSLIEIPAAIRYLEQGHARGNVVVTMSNL